MTNQRGAVMAIVGFIVVICFIMYQMMEMSDKINRIDTSTFITMGEFHKKIIALEDILKEKEGNQSADEISKKGEDGSTDTKKLIDSIQQTMMEFMSSDIPLMWRKYWTYFPHVVEHLNTMDENDPRLIQHIKDNLFVTPAPKTAPYAFSDKRADFSEGQVAHIRNIFKNMTKGFYVECGGCDGEWYSNTIPLERELGWEGMLIEADPYMFDVMIKRHRKAWTVPACISLKNKPTMVSFDRRSFSIGRVGFEKKAEDAAKKTVANSINAHCMPFASIMYAFNRTSIDLFSLDVEGHELDILKTIPWDKIDIKVLMVEHFQNPPQKEPMKKYMAEKGFKTYGEELNEKWSRENFMFIKISSGL